MQIIAIVDTGGHCFTTTVASLAACSEHEITIMNSSEYNTYRKTWSYKSPDLLYFRSWWPKLQPDDDTPWIVTVSTGGDVARERLEHILDNAHPPPTAVITQNDAAHRAALSLGLVSAMLPSGVDTYRYQPGWTIGLAVGIAASASNEREKGVTVSSAAAYSLGLDFRRAGNVPYADMPGWYQALWAYCHPSTREGASNSVFEAMATGLPVLICEGVGYHGEVCRDARTNPDGEVLFVEQDADSIVRALTALREDPQLYRRMSTNARRFALAHAWPVVAKRFDELFAWAAAQRAT
jgi:hypothetical protein